MAIKLMYITNSVEVARIAQKAGVDRIWIDMEYMGKDVRQHGMDTVKSHHTIEDIKKLRPVVDKAELMVRINPIHDKTEEEIEQTIKAGADIIMLPMFKTDGEVRRFVEAVNHRAKTIILVETAEAVENLKSILKVDGIDEVHIGLNDLHLAYGRKFMFELLADGTVDNIISVVKKYGYTCGFGGLARIGYGILPAEFILREHYRLGSDMVILSRSFCNANSVTDYEKVEKLFVEGVKNIRREEEIIADMTTEALNKNHEKVCEKIHEITKSM